MPFAKTNLGRFLALALAAGPLYACGSEIHPPQDAAADSGNGSDGSTQGGDGGTVTDAHTNDAPVIGPSDSGTRTDSGMRTDSGTTVTDSGTTVTDSGPPPDANTGDPYDSARDACVANINMYRAMVGQPPYERWREGEACADQMATSDSMTNQAHGGFMNGICSPRGNGQNECPGWGGPDQLPGCLAAMWNEGPSATDSSGNYLWDTAHGHWLNMYGDYVYSGFMQHFTRVACGYSAGGWMVQDFQ